MITARTVATINGRMLLQRRRHRMRVQGSIAMMRKSALSPLSRSFYLDISGLRRSCAGRAALVTSSRREDAVVGYP